VIDRRDQLKAQARHDLRLFLTLRAEEFKAGAPLVLSFVSAASSGMANYAPLVDACRTALMQMLRRFPHSISKSLFGKPSNQRMLEMALQQLDWCHLIQNRFFYSSIYSSRLLHHLEAVLGIHRPIGYQKHLIVLLNYSIKQLQLRPY